MPTLSRLIIVLLLLGSLGYGAVYALATWINPDERQYTVRINRDGFGR